MKTKSRLAFLGLFLLALAVSCNKDDPAPASIIGTWKLSSESLTNCTDPADNGVDNCTGTCPTLVIAESTWTYADPSNPSNSGAGTYTISGNTLTTTVTAGSGLTGTYTFSVTSTALTISDPNYGGGCTGNLNFTRL